MIVIIMTIILVVAHGRCRSYHCIVNIGSARESQRRLKTGFSVFNHQTGGS
jgi:hypothetical protein